MSFAKPGRHALLVLGVHALLFTAIGCASAPSEDTRTGSPSATERLAGAPAWVVRGCRAFWTDPARRREIVCGVGSAPAHRNRVAARETAIARARAELARSLQVTIESAVRLEDGTNGTVELDAIVHQLASESLRGVQLEAVWRADIGETHALVSLDVDRVRESVRSTKTLSPVVQQDLAARAMAAFEALDTAYSQGDPEGGPEESPETR